MFILEDGSVHIIKNKLVFQLKIMKVIWQQISLVDSYSTSNIDFKLISAIEVKKSRKVNYTY